MRRQSSLLSKGVALCCVISVSGTPVSQIHLQTLASCLHLFIRHGYVVQAFQLLKPFELTVFDSGINHLPRSFCPKQRVRK